MTDTFGTTTTTASGLLGAAGSYGMDTSTAAGTNAPLSDASNPFAVGPGSEDKGMVQVRNRNNPYSTGAIPSRFEDAYTSAGLLRAVSTMSEPEKMALKQRLWFAGYYGDDAIYKGGVPTDGAWSTSEDDALGKWVADARSTGAAMEDVLERRSAEMRQVHRDATLEAYDIPGTVDTLQKWAVNDLGRELDEGEIERLMASITGPQGSSPQSPAEAALMNRDQQGIGYVDEAGNPIAAPETLSGGGPDSTAIQFGKGLASMFGVSVVQDFTSGDRYAPDAAYRDGLGVSVAGSQENMARLHDWATQNMGDDGTFSQVQMRYDDPQSDQPTSVSLVMRPGAPRPNISANIGSTDQTTAFLEAIKRPGPDEAVFGSWDGEGPHRRGAYGISDQIWDYYTSRLGLDSADHSRQAQNRVAAVYAGELYNRFGNWEDVAVAFRKNEDEAYKRAETRKTGVGRDDWDTSEDEWVRSAIADMGNVSFNRQWGGAVGGTDTYSSMYGGGSVPYVDYSQAIRSNDPRWWDARVRRGYRNVMGARVDAERVALALMDIQDGKTKAASTDFY